MPENVTLGFGRSTNDGGELSETEWSEFQNEVVALVEALYGDVHFRGTGTGYWDGAEEIAACVAFFADHRFDYEALRDGLHTLVIAYRQDAIAVTAAESELVSA